MNLYEATRELHHEAERHAWGARMAVGEIGVDEWAAWLHANLALHDVVDDFLPPYCRRTASLTDDLAAHGHLPLPTPRAAVPRAAMGGYAYILLGAHFRGGAVIRKRLKPKGFACSHMHFDEPALVHRYLLELREETKYAEGARHCFQHLIDVMEEINSGCRVNPA